MPLEKNSFLNKIKDISGNIYNELMTTLDFDSNGEMFSKLRDKINDVSGSPEFLKLHQKFTDMSGKIFRNNEISKFKIEELNHESQYHGDDEHDPKEEFGGIVDDLGISAISDFLVDMVKFFGENGGGFITSIFIPPITILINKLVYGDGGDLGKKHGYSEDNGLYDGTVCKDSNGNCICTDGCNINKGIIGKIFQKITKMKILKDDGDTEKGFFDYITQTKLMIMAILLSFIIWKFLSISKKLTLFLVGPPS